MTHRLRLYDRLRGEIVAVEPSTPGVLRVYSCGPTVYGRIHVGNARPYWTAMVLKRASEQLLDLPVRLAINITDINDKIYAAAVAQGVPSALLAGQMAEAYRTDTDALGLGRPDSEPLASDDDRGDHRADRAPDRERRRLCERRRRRLLQRRGLSALRRALRPAARRADRRLARRAGRGQARAARLRALEGHEARTRTPPGTRPGGAGARAGTSSARPWRTPSWARTSTCTAAGST